MLNSVRIVIVLLVWGFILPISPAAPAPAAPGQDEKPAALADDDSEEAKKAAREARRKEKAEKLISTVEGALSSRQPDVGFDAVKELVKKYEDCAREYSGRAEKYYGITLYDIFRYLRHGCSECKATGLQLCDACRGKTKVYLEQGGRRKAIPCKKCGAKGSYACKACSRKRTRKEDRVEKEIAQFLGASIPPEYDNNEKLSIIKLNYPRPEIQVFDASLEAVWEKLDFRYLETYDAILFNRHLEVRSAATIKKIFAREKNRAPGEPEDAEGENGGTHPYRDIRIFLYQFKENLEKEKPVVLFQALDSIKEILDATDERAPLLILQYLNPDYPDIHRLAAEVLTQTLKGVSLNPLREFVREAEANTKPEIIQLFSHYRDAPDAESALIAMLSEEEGRKVLDAIADELGEIGGMKSMVALEKLLKSGRTTNESNIRFNIERIGDRLLEESSKD